MSNRRKLIGAAAIAAGLAGGGAAGALLGLPATSLAQTDDSVDDDTGTTAEDGSVEGRGRHFRHHGSLGGAVDLGVAAEALGITEDELDTALEDGGSIASVAEERGVDLQTVVDALVADATTSIDERVAELKEDLPERVADLVEREGIVRGRGFGPGPLGGRGLGLVDPDVAAEALGITDDDLRDALEAGDSISDVAEAEGVEVQVVIDALVAAGNAEIDDEVADGDLTEDDAAELREDLPERMTDLVEGTGFGRHPGVGRHPGFGGPGPGPGGSEG